ncbi:hypothetical protein [Phycicoccus sonneratiae]|uniref:C2H2-type domain-containing protein n=1 Tax=Phycicoccus sonneratiae TaxID=2807628 RepID=A0ABS2CQT7_9MICO|nr:hypothetical protein [Phycicoccus sonneraticus]MBM6402160.1 hypothetical protein [Phycicoccus sonneraticus]
MSDPAAIRWVRTGRAPEPDFVLGDAHKLWLESTIRRWLDSCDLASCPDCGARCVSVNRHRAGAHKARRPGRPEQDSSSRPTSTS